MLFKVAITEIDEQARLKSDVRRLKRLGLTRSLESGYELSPRGQAYLDRSTRTVT